MIFLGEEQCLVGATFMAGANVTVSSSQPLFNCNTLSFRPQLPLPNGLGEYNWECQDSILISPLQNFMTIQVSKSGDYLNGVSTLDVILIQRHILSVQPIQDPFRQIAADVDLSGTISNSDVLRIQRVILGSPGEDWWPSGSYRFIPRFYFITTPGFCSSFAINPFNTPVAYPNYTNGTIAFGMNLNPPFLPWFDFYGIKMRDVSNNANPEQLTGQTPVEFRAQARILKRAGTNEQTLSAHPRVTIGSKDLNDLGGIQLGIKLPSTVKNIRLTDIQLPDFNEDNYSIKRSDGGSYELRVSWAKWDQQWKPTADIRDGFTEFFTLDLEMSTSGEKITDILSLSPFVFISELYSSEGEILDRPFMISYDENDPNNGGTIIATSTVLAGQLMVKISGVSPGNLFAALTDMRGVSVLKRSAQVDLSSRDIEISFPVFSLPKGLYILRLVNGGQSRSIKVVL